MATTQWTTSTTIASVSLGIILKLVSNNWYEIKKVKGTKPQARYRHSAVVIDNQMIVFGGVDAEQKRYNDV